jgi:subfamily B ATP-binding cassette protein HlyB/CyaB
MPEDLSQSDLVWALGSLCALHRLPFSAETVWREFPPPVSHATLIAAARALQLHIRQVPLRAGRIQRMAFPLLVALKPAEGEQGHDPSLGLVTAADEGQVVLFKAGCNTPETLSPEQFDKLSAGRCWLTRPQAEALHDPDAMAQRRFGFGWFVPELLKHRQVWRDVLLASLALQLIALATPLFTQAIIDKVVVHRTQSTLIAIGVAMAIFTVFTSLLTWGRQYLVLHTGNRVDAVLGAAVWDHLLKLPLQYFEHRPTGVVAARLHGVETIRQFVSGAAVSLVLDLPFLLICLAVMFWYSALLSCLALSVLLVIGVVSALVAPAFQRQLNEQFLMSARNQAFVTEHIAGFETVKSLQMEPQLKARYARYLASLLHAGFKTQQVGNTYNVFATTMDQLQTLLILMVGAYTVMNEASFTIGMLVAFQMFSGKLSQPVLRIVGLWSQFQQASLSVRRLGDVMNAPQEPYGLTPRRAADGKGRIEVQGLAFRYADDRPLLYQDLSLTIEPGQAVALMGASGTGKSTLAKLLLGFYQPSAGGIRIDGIDIRHMAANELRSHFGVVPQETMLFSGTIRDNLLAANPAASFDQIARACRMAGIHEVIEQLPQGYLTEVGERGTGLSGGQKQRLAIARALLKGPRVLIFDEATSALDSATAEAFAQTVNTLKGKVTLLFISHALPKALQLDAVIRLDGGRARRVEPPGLHLTPRPGSQASNSTSASCEDSSH